MPKINLLNYDRIALRGLFLDLGEKSYHADQTFKWIHQFGQINFESMTNLSKNLRDRLTELAEIKPLNIQQEEKSEDGTIKWLVRLEDNNCIETVFIPEDGRGTLCVSSQVGCALNCSFCATAQQGFNRNLTVAEIIGQIWLAARQLSINEGRHDRSITNIVMMGMGEPLLNFENVVTAMGIMMDDMAYGLSKYKVTLSTSGVVPAIYQLGQMSEVSLAISLHAATDDLRNELVPINKKYPLKELMEACRQYFKLRGEPKRQILFEYVMLNKVNDSLVQARKLTKLLNGIPAKVNLIPFNSFANQPYQCSSQETIELFRNFLTSEGIHTITRKTRGADIDAACGQLVGKVIDRTSRSARFKNIAIAQEF